MSGDDGEEDFVTVYAGSTSGEVLKIGVSSNEYGEVRTSSQ